MSGSSIGGVVGGVIGFYFGNPQLGWMIGSAIGGAIDPDVIKGPRLDLGQKQTSQEGAPRPLIYGRAAVMGNVIQCGPLVEHKKRESSKGGPVQETYTYTRTVAIRIAEAAPLGGNFVLMRVWMNDKLVYDLTGTGTLTGDSAKFASVLRFYSGSEFQLPDPSLEALPVENGGGVGNVPAYRGTCYAVLTNLDCTDFGGAVPQFKWEVSSCGEVVGGGDPQRPFWWMIHSPEGEVLYVGSADGNDWNDSYATGSSAYFPTALPDGTIFAGANVKSTNYAQSFANVPTAPSISTPIYRLGSGRLVGASGTNVYYTDDKWATYTTVAAGFTVAWIAAGGSAMDVVVIGNDVGSQHKVSTDSAATFGSAVTNTQNLTSGNYHDGLWVFGGGFDHMAYSEDDDAASLTYVAATGVGQSTTVCPAGGGAWISIRRQITASTTNRIFRSPDGKSDWASVTTPECKFEASDSLRAGFSGGVVIVAAENAAGRLLILRSEDDGLTFEEVAHGYGASADYGIGVVAFPELQYTGIPIPDAPGYYYDRSTGEVNGFSLGHVETCAITLDEVVGDLTERGNVFHYDVAALASDVVLGYAITTPTTSAGGIKSLQQVYFFDYSEWGNSGDATTMLHAVKRGGSAVWSLDDDDLIDADDEETRAQAVEFPRKVNLISLSPTANYNPIKQTAERESENVRAIGEMTIDTAVIFERDEAAQRVEILSKVMTEEALGRAEVTVPEEFTRFTTSDCGTWKGKRWRIDKIEAGDGESKWYLTRDRASAYISTALGSTALSPTAAASSMRGPTMFAAMNLPRLKSSDSSPGMYIAVCGLMPAWAGCDLYLSADGGLTEQRVATIIDPAVMGVLTDAITDSDEPLSVDLYDGEVSDATDAQLAARMNAAAVTSSGVSEILQFKDADQTDNLADLTTLTRGLLSTVAASHAADDSFVLLDGSVYFLPLDISLAGKELIFRPVTRGTVPANNPTYSVTFSPMFLGPQVVEQITVGGDVITVGGQSLVRVIPDAY